MARRTTTGPRRRLTLGLAAALSVPLALGAAAAPAAEPQASGEPVSWTAPLSAVDGDDSNVRYGKALTLADPDAATTSARPGAEGYLVSAERRLEHPVNRVRARTAATVPEGTSVHVDVRGLLGPDRWSEWVPATGQPALLDRPVTTVQVRVGLFSDDTGATPSVRRVELVADRVGGEQATALAGERTYRVFATREGLVGGTTANGHVIKSRDHFVALPSGKSLAPKNSGAYTVRVCRTDNSRCEYAPVWDVGPWNTKDDYWNPAAERQMWKDLPQGKPEAQAAYQDGYNGGRDQFGRRVANPAGIDLADGTFWDGLNMSDNGWVNVTYLWTGTGRTGEVTTAGDPLTVRASGSTSAAVRGFAANHAKVTLECYVRGETVTGRFGTSDIWNRIGPGHYVSDTYLLTGSDEPVVPRC
ncbi:hypothetical protein B0I33_103379 [Prauserella shujinwangii]|uniref:Secreted protein n=1 Tax=Prauserella shujinwangii TaxID=1453103 RepID=A0A2T0LZ09_9PSEU|nr:hypothetical protein [Prauserella shujinwangii]PRX49344.1 hypothetical protein B0I33_103379 [Prauserella shujinwangii]